MHLKQKVIMCTSVEITIKITTGLHYHDTMYMLTVEPMENIYLLKRHPARNGPLTNPAHKSGYYKSLMLVSNHLTCSSCQW